MFSKGVPGRVVAAKKVAPSEHISRACGERGRDARPGREREGGKDRERDKWHRRQREREGERERGRERKKGIAAWEKKG